ncbi:MAG: tetratricopeptide repeat protein [Oligoflexales bacterium]
MAVPKPPFTEIIFFSSRMEIRDAVREAVKKFSSAIKIIPVANSDLATEEISKNDRSLLILDWELGPEAIVETLEKSAKSQKIETRPILLIANSVSKHLVGVSYEYHVSKLHAGEISIKKILELLKMIAQDEGYNGPLRNILSKVNKNRSAGDWDGATSLLEGLQKKLPNNPKVAAELAVNRIYANQWEQALSLLEPIEYLDPPYIRALQLLSRCRMKIGKFKEASESLKKAKLINPFNVDRLLQLGKVLINCDEIGEAKSVFQEARGLAPDNQEALKGEGQCLLLEGEVNEALDLLNSIESPRELASVFNSSAVFTMRKGKYQQGMELYDSALTAIKEDNKIAARLLFNKGIGYRRWQKNPEALNCLEKAIRMDDSFEKAKRSYTDLAGKLGKGVPPEFAIPSLPSETSENVDENVDESIGLDFTLSSKGDNVRPSMIDEFDDEIEDDDDDDDSLDFL